MTPIMGKEMRVRLGAFCRFLTPSAGESGRSVPQSEIARAPAPMTFRLVALCLLLSSALQMAHGQTLSADSLKQIQFNLKPGTQIPLDLKFQDEAGKTVRLGDCFGQKPVILVLGYYRCPMLCSVVLNGMIGSVQDMAWDIGKQFEVINVSIDPGETPALAAAKKRSYVTRYGRPGAGQGWHFLVGGAPAIRQLTETVGFEYAYDAQVQQYAHPSGLVVLTAKGKVSQYLSGVEFSTPVLQRALETAAAQKIGSPLRQLFMLCFHYGPATGKYGRLVLLAVRVTAVLTLLVLVKIIFGLRRQDRRAAPSPTPGPAKTG